MKMLIFSPQSTLSSTLTGRTLKLMKGIKINNELKIYCLHGDSNKNLTEISDGFNINYFGSMLVKKTKNNKEYYSFIKVIWLFFLATLKESQLLFKNLDYDNIYFVKNQPMHIMPALICKIFKKKVILDIDDLEYKSNKKFCKILGILDKILPSISNKIFVCSPYLLNVYSKYKDVTYLPTPLEEIKIKKKNNEEKCIIYFGSVSIHSGHRVDLLLESMQELYKKGINIKTYILGDGADLVNLQKKYSNLIDKGIICFLGRYNKKILSKFLEKNCIIIDPIDDTLQNKAKSSSRLLIAAYTIKPYITFRIKDSIQDYYLSKNFPGFIEKNNVKSLSKKILFFTKNSQKINFKEYYPFIREFYKKEVQDKFRREMYELK